MAGRRVSWYRALEVYAELSSGTSWENDENVSPILGNEIERLEQRFVYARCPPWNHPRIPLRDVTHLFYGNMVSSDDKTNLGLPVPPAQENGRLRRSAPPAGQNPRKRRQVQSVAEPARCVLRRTFR